MKNLDIILTIDVVEPDLVRAVHKLSEELGRPLKGIVLVSKVFADFPERPRDHTGLFEEINCDFDNQDEMQQLMKSYSDRLLAVTYRFEESSVQLRKLLPFIPYLHAPGETSLLWASEKHLMRDRLRGYDENLVPKYKKLEKYDPEIIKDIVSTMQFPMIVKPSALYESLLVSEVKNEEELAICLKHTFESIIQVYAKAHQILEPRVLVEEFMLGKLYSIDAYVNYKGDIFHTPPVGVTIAHDIGLPGFYSFETFVPSGLSEPEINDANKTASAAIKALNLRSTSTHIEMFNGPDGWKVIEIGSRIGGYRDLLYREGYGIEHYLNDLKIHMGMEPVINHVPTGNAVALNLYGDNEGTLVSIGDFEAASKLESVVYLNKMAEIGEQVTYTDTGGVWVINGILSNKDADTLAQDVTKLRELIKIDITPK